MEPQTETETNSPEMRREDERSGQRNQFLNLNLQHQLIFQDTRDQKKQLEDIWTRLQHRTLPLSHPYRTPADTELSAPCAIHG